MGSCDPMANIWNRDPNLSGKEWRRNPNLWSKAMTPGRFLVFLLGAVVVGVVLGLLHAGWIITAIAIFSCVLGASAAVRRLDGGGTT